MRGDSRVPARTPRPRALGGDLSCARKTADAEGGSAGPDAWPGHVPHTETAACAGRWIVVAAVATRGTEEGRGTGVDVESFQHFRFRKKWVRP